MIRVAVVEDDAEVQGVLQEYIRRQPEASLRTF